MPKLIELHRRLEGQGLVLLGIHTKNRGEQMAEYAEEVGIRFPIAVDVDGKTVASFAVDSYPDYYLIDRAGNLRVADLANADLERAIGVLLAEPVPVAEPAEKPPEGGGDAGVPPVVPPVVPPDQPPQPPIGKEKKRGGGG